MRASSGQGPLVLLFLVLLLGGALLLLVLERAGSVASSPASDPSVAAVSVDLVPNPEVPAEEAPEIPTASGSAERQELLLPARDQGFITGVVLDREGQPVEGATCSLLAGRAPSGLESYAYVPPERTTHAKIEASELSDPGGRFRLAARAGHWLLRVEAPGAHPWEEDHLKPGDFRWVRLEESIELFVRVLGTSGDPLQGSRLELLQSEYSPSHLAVARAETGFAGTASVDVPAGHWFLAVRHPDHRPHFEPLTIAPGARRLVLTIPLDPGIRVHGRVSTPGAFPPPSGTKVFIDSILGFQESLELACEADGRFSSGHSLSPGQLLEVAALAPGFGEVRKELDLESLASTSVDVEVQLVLDSPERTARGQVVDVQGQPLAGVALFVKPLLALPAESGTAGILGPQESNEAQWRWVGRTDPDGAFRVGGMDRRRPYALLLLSERHANARRWIEAGDSTVDLGTVDLGIIVLAIGGRIHGVVRTRDGSPVAGLGLSTIWLNRIQALPGKQPSVPRSDTLTGAFDAITNRDGLFAIEPLPEGEFFLAIGHERFGPFVLRAGENRGPEILEIEDDPRLGTTPSARISGRVIGVDGAPIGSSFVQLFRRRTGVGGGELLAAGSVGVQGEFDLSARPPGPFLLRAIDLGGGFLEETFEFESAEAWRPGDVVLLPDPRGGASLHGTVSASSGEMLPGMSVTLHVSPSVTSCTCVSRTVSTDVSGRFDFGPLAAGLHRIVVTDPEGRFVPQDRYPVQAGDILELILSE